MEFGACDGYHSRLMLDIICKKTNDFIYHLFEPKKDLHDSIHNRIGHILNQLPERVKLFDKAIGANNGTMTFYVSGGQKIVNGQVTENYYGSSSIRKPKLVTEAWKEMTFYETSCVVTTFDEHIKSHGLVGRTIDFIWADIQGAEIDLINGGTNTFKNVKYFYTEYANAEFYEGEIGLPEICKMLPDFEVVEDYGGDVLLKNKLL
jgi:FkbM family methyltransferase